MYIQKIKPPFFAYHLNYYFTFIPFTFKHFARKPRLDLACGQGNAAKACLQERLPYTGFVLSEAHGRRLESLLTNFICEQMKQEGSPHYRPEACSQQEEETDKQNKRPGTGPAEGAPKKKPRKKKGEAGVEGQPPATGEGEGGGEEGEGGEGEGSETLPW